MGTPSQMYRDMSVAKRNGELCESEGHRWNAVVGIWPSVGVPARPAKVLLFARTSAHGARAYCKAGRAGRADIR